MQISCKNTHCYNYLNFKWLLKVKVPVSPLQTMKAHRNVDTRIHIFAVSALGRGRVVSPTLGRLYRRKAQVLISQEAERTSGPFWTRMSKEKYPLLRQPGSNPGRPARTEALCRLSYRSDFLSPIAIVVYLIAHNIARRSF